MFNYDADRIKGQKEAICNRSANAVMEILNAAASYLDHPGEKVCLLAGCAVPSLGALAIVFGRKDPNEDGGIDMEPDDMMFGALYLVCCLEECTVDGREGFVAGFSAEILQKTLDLFKSITGRNYPLNEGAAGALNFKQTNAAAGTPDHLKRFLPN